MREIYRIREKMVRLNADIPNGVFEAIDFDMSK